MFGSIWKWNLAMIAFSHKASSATRVIAYIKPAAHAFIFVLILAACGPFGVGPALATPFTINSLQTLTTPQTLATGESGAINSGGALSVSGGAGVLTMSGNNTTLTVNAGGTLTGSGNSVAVTISGNNATVTNLGTMTQTNNNSNQNERLIRDNTGVTGLLINNGSLTNSTALMQTQNADVIQMNKPSASVLLNNYGTLTSRNSPTAGGAQAVDFNAITSGPNVTGYTSNNVVNNFATGTIQAAEADAVRPGVNGLVNNAGTIRSTSGTGSSSDGVDAQTNSGVSVTNASDWLAGAPLTPGHGLIEGARHGITGGAVLPKNLGDGTFLLAVTNNFGGTIQGDNGSGINIDGFNNKEVVTIVNNGLITGKGVTGDGDGVDVDGLVSLTNTGTIKSLNSLNDVSEGVTVGGGTIINSLTGTIQGSISNGTGTGRGITIAGIDKNPDTDAAIPVQAPYGPTTIINSGLIKGDSDSGIAFTSALVSGFSNTITNTATGIIQGGGTIAIALQTGADNDTINNAGIIDGSSGGKAINMGAGNNTLNITGGSILGSIDGGVGGTNAMIVDAGAGNRFTLSGPVSDFNTVEVKSGALSLGASNEFNGTENLILSGGTFDLNNYSDGAAGAAGIGTLSLFANATFDFGDLGLGSNMVEFGGVGAHTFGTTLQVADYDIGLDHFYFTGLASDFTGRYGQSDVCFDGGCGYRTISFNGYYEVLQAPEPVTLSLVGLGLAGLGFGRRRQAS
jgi:hypothetical protein